MATKPAAVAFPSDYSGAGLTKREYFTALALQGLCANPAVACDEKAEGFFANAPVAAVIMADRIINELNKEIKA